MKFLAALALPALLAGPALAHPPCRSCYYPPVRFVKKAPPVAVKKEKVFVEKVVQSVVTVFEPVYLAQVQQAPSVTYNITTPAPPPQPVQQFHTYAAPPSVSASVYSSQRTVQAAGAAAAVQSYHPPAPPPAAAQAAPQDRLAAILEKIDGRLCTVEQRLGIAPAAPPAALPQALGTKCAACHNAAAAKRDGGEFVMFEKGSLAQFSERDLRMIYKHVDAGTMPPPGNAKGVAPLTPQEQAEVRAWVGRQE